MKNKAFVLLLIFVMLLGASGCEKPPGKGGTSKIKGKVYIRKYNSNFTILQGSYYASQENVYIIYGNETFYGDNIKTSYDGTYEFNYLRKGMYRIFAYTKDSTLATPGGVYPVIDTVEITGEFQTIEVPTITLLK